MKSTVKSGKQDGLLIVTMDEKIDTLRKEIWKTIYKNKGDLSSCDVSMALSIVQYECIHHSDEK